MGIHAMKSEGLELFLYFDGASRGNPGKAGAGALIYDQTNNKELRSLTKYLGIKTNNEAEYNALILGLQYVVDLLAQKITVSHLEIRGDSQLIIRQTRGEYRVNKPHLKPLANQVQELLRNLRKYIAEVNIHYLPREENRMADSLANQAIDQR
jgi:ribonuclease HI